MRKENDAFIIDMVGSQGERFGFLLMSDVHIDSLKCERNLLISHLKYALERNLKVLIFGDLFDCMGGKYDKRTSKGDLRPEYQVDDYFNAIVEDAARILGPYSEIIEGIGEGNHETSIKKHHEIDLTKMICKELGVTPLPYSGFIRFKYERNGGGARSSKVMYYTHGNGGNSPVTKGVIQTNRRQVQIQADYFVSGHNHNEFILPLPRVELTDLNRLKFNNVVHINTGTYKREWGKSAFSQEKGFSPEVLGCARIEIRKTKEGLKEEVSLMD
jgi:hypothetical protein